MVRLGGSIKQATPILLQNTRISSSSSSSGGPGPASLTGSISGRSPIWWPRMTVPSSSPEPSDSLLLPIQGKRTVKRRRKGVSVSDLFRLFLFFADANRAVFDSHRLSLSAPFCPHLSLSRIGQLFDDRSHLFWQQNILSRKKGGLASEKKTVK